MGTRKEWVLEGLSVAGEGVGQDELVEVLTNLLVCFVVLMVDGGVLNGADHAFQLPVGPVYGQGGSVL